MIANLLLAVGVICLILGLLALFSVIGLAAETLLIVAVICLVIGYFMRGRL